jgi:hypothetical protein
VAKKKTEKEYQEWMEDVMEKAPQELHSALKSVLDAPAGMELFGGHLREREFHKRLSEIDEARKTFEQERQELANAQSVLANDAARLEGWVQTEVPKFEQMKAERNRLRAEREALRSRLAEFGVEEPTLGGPVVKTEDNKEANSELIAEVRRLQQQVASMDATMPVLLSDYGTVLNRAIKENFELDPKALIDHATQKSGNLIRSYEELTAPQRAKRAEEAYKAEIEKVREETRREMLAQGATPERLRPSGPTIVDTIKGAGVTQDQRVSSAVDAWNKAVAENPASAQY